MDCEAARINGSWKLQCLALSEYKAAKFHLLIHVYMHILLFNMRTKGFFLYI